MPNLANRTRLDVRLSVHTLVCDPQVQQRLAIHFAGFGQRKGIADFDVPREHIAVQVVSGGLAQVSDKCLAVAMCRLWNDERDKAFGLTGLIVQNDRSILNTVLGAEDFLDAVDFHPPPVQFDLAIHATVKLQNAVWTFNRRIARQIEERTVSVWVCDKGAVRRMAVSQITKGDTRAANRQLPQHTRFNGVEVSVQQMRRIRGKRHANWNGPSGQVVFAYNMACAVVECLGRAIAIDKGDAGEPV